MGYFSQRKKHERANLILNITLTVIAVFTVLSFFDSSISRFFDLLGFWRFHYYVITLAAFFYALAGRFFVHAAAAFVLLTINYAAIASSANIFSNAAHEGENRLTVLYQNNVRHTEPLVRDAEEANADIIGVNHRRIPAYLPESFGSYQLFHQEGDAEKSFILTRKTPLRAGKLRLTAERTASFLTFEAGGRNLIFVNVNFAGLTGSEEKTVFGNLAEFVLSQDEPLIIVGDFGIPAWSETFRTFLAQTGLEVKNHIIMSDGSSRFNLFTVPSVNVLGYRSLGLENIDILPAHKGSRPFRFDLIF